MILSRWVVYAILFPSCFVSSICFAVQDPNSINFKDPFYAEVLKASVNELYLTESGEIPDDEEAYQKKKIIKDANYAEQHYSQMLDQWHEPNLVISEYQDAAYWILTHFEINEKRLLTFGLAIDTFGVPDTVDFVGYCSDEFGTEASTLRFKAKYQARGVELGFSAMGFCCGDTLISSMHYTNIIRWPQNYSYVNQRPILYGLKKEGVLYKKLCQVIEKIQLEKRSYYDWVGYMEGWPKDFKVEQAAYNLEIMMIDHALDNLAIIYLKITRGKETLYCGTWWERKMDGWVLLNDEQVSRYFKNLTSAR